MRAVPASRASAASPGRASAAACSMQPESTRLTSIRMGDIVCGAHACVRRCGMGCAHTPRACVRASTLAQVTACVRACCHFCTCARVHGHLRGVKSARCPPPLFPRTHTRASRAGAPPTRAVAHTSRSSLPGDPSASAGHVRCPGVPGFGGDQTPYGPCRRSASPRRRILGRRPSPPFALHELTHELEPCTHEFEPRSICAAARGGRRRCRRGSPVFSSGTRARAGGQSDWGGWTKTS